MSDPAAGLGWSRYRALEPRLTLLFAVLASLGVVWSIWSVPIVLSNDGPQAVLLAHIDAHYDDPGAIYPAQFDRGLGFSGRGFMFVYGPLSSVLGWLDALRATQVLILLVFAWGTLMLARAVSGAFTPKGLLGFVLTFNWPFYMGFYAFSVASALVPWVLWFTVSHRELSKIHRAGISVALVCVLLCHPVVSVVAVVAVGSIVVARLLSRREKSRRVWLAEAAWLLVTLLPHVAVFVVMMTASSQMAQVAYSESLAWLIWWELVRTMPRILFPQSDVLGFCALAFGVIVPAVALFAKRGERRPEVRALAFSALGLFVFTLAGPFNVPGWQFFAPRFSALALLMAASVVPTVPRVEVRPLAMAAVLALTTYTVAIARSFYLEMATACGDVLAYLDQPFQRKGMALPAILDSTCGMPTRGWNMTVPYVTQELHIHTLFPVAHGGSTLHVFSGAPAVHVLVPKPVDLAMPPINTWGFPNDHPVVNDPTKRGRLLDQLALYGMNYESFQVLGANEADRALLLERGYVIEFEQGHFISARFEPCRVDVLVAQLPDDPDIAVRGGIRDLEVWESVWVEPTRAAFIGACGSLWATVRWGDGVQRCKNADAAGHIAVENARHDAVVEVRCER